MACSMKYQFFHLILSLAKNLWNPQHFVYFTKPIDKEHDKPSVLNDKYQYVFLADPKQKKVSAILKKWSVWNFQLAHK